MVVCFCTEIRSAFCIVPVQASGIFGQVRLACACPSFACLLCCLRSCAHPSQLRSCLSLHSRTISLTTARSLSPLSIYLSLIFSSSFSLLLSAHLHLNMPRFIASASSGRKHRGHSLPSFFFHPPTFPLGTADMQRMPHRNPSL